MRHLHEWVVQAVAEPRTLRDTLVLFVQGMIELHGDRPRLQHILLEEVALPEPVHEALLAGEREAAKLITGLLCRYPEVRHPRLSDASVMVVHTVQGLVHRFAAHPAQGLPRKRFAAELVNILEAYLTRGQ